MTEMEDRGKAIICEEIVLKIAWSTFVLSKTRSSIVTPEKLQPFSVACGIALKSFLGASHFQSRDTET